MPDLFPHVKKWHSTRNSACFSRFFDSDGGLGEVERAGKEKRTEVVEDSRAAKGAAAE